MCHGNVALDEKHEKHDYEAGNAEHTENDCLLYLSDRQSIHCICLPVLLSFLSPSPFPFHTSHILIALLGGT